jgi:hypothetical protein
MQQVSLHIGRASMPVPALPVLERSKCRRAITPRLPRLDVDVPRTELCVAWCLPPGLPGFDLLLQPSRSLAPAAVSWAATPRPPPAARPAQQPVYAFLPLRSYGLRFVVQVGGRVGAAFTRRKGRRF